MMYQIVTRKDRANARGDAVRLLPVPPRQTETH